MIHTWRSLIIVAALTGFVSTALWGTKPGGVKVEELKATVGSNPVVNARVRNTSAQRIEVNVAVEKQVENQWAEILASITDSKHPYGKTVRLIPIEGGTLLPVSFMPFGKYMGVRPLKPSPIPLWLRLRVDIYGPHGGKLLDTIWSSPVQVSAAPVAAPSGPGSHP